MGRFIALQEYGKRKYLITTAVNFIVAIAGLFITVYVYNDALQLSDITVPITLGSIIALLILSYIIAYLHERIPHCTSPRIDAVVRFTGMVMLFALPISYLFMQPKGLFDMLFWLDVTAAIAGIPAIITVLLMYRFAKKDLQ